VFGKAASEVEDVIETCARILMSEAPDSGEQAVLDAGGGKPSSGLTLGEHINVIRKLSGRRIRKQENRLLERIVVLRNDFVHGRLAHDAMETTQEFLSAARQLCSCRLIDSLQADA
jgi:hypothetical protein